MNVKFQSVHMTRIVAAASAWALCLAAMAGQAHANLITDGSFESTAAFTPNSDDTMRLGVGATALAGWSVVSNEVAWIGPSNPFGFGASDGAYSLDLQSYTDGAPYGGVTQSVATTAGARYLLTFDLGAFEGVSQITASAGDASGVFTSPATPDFGWTAESLAFTATGSSTLVSLMGTLDSSTYVGLDHVGLMELSAAPEPGTWVLLWVAVGGAGLSLRRARAAARFTGSPRPSAW